MKLLSLFVLGGMMFDCSVHIYVALSSSRSMCTACIIILLHPPPLYMYFEYVYRTCSCDHVVPSLV